MTNNDGSVFGYEQAVHKQLSQPISALLVCSQVGTASLVSPPRHFPFSVPFSKDASVPLRRLFFVRPAWASTWRWKSSRELVTASEVNRRALDREDGVKEAGSEAAG